ncbi:extracellular solute-binding protein family 1 [Janthinobacterium sp. HH01]|uniref:ABC transporter substrate-binding protein n=1 Tax=Janthinobacterium sp. HH01 TaxID=1198452 RepID=UPI0002AE8E73|nr:ABC transporter substrate-binding protein [Janthinobacterium sp. HH01]ELX09948.1 extracellular solute-binding protein family 1 [Janthinobacterium sp. HH01]
MNKQGRGGLAAGWLAAWALAAGAAQAAAPAGPRAEVMHWWTSSSESAAVRKFAEAYRAAGGVWVDTAVAGADQAKAVAINRIVGGNPPTAAQFNTTKQFRDLIDQGSLNNVDDIAARDHWDQLMPGPMLDVIRVNGHYYALPVDIHMSTWIWYSKAAFKKAGIAKEPATPDELFAALDRLKAAGVVGLAHGGQPWQENILFQAMLANVGGKQLYLQVLRDRDPKALNSEAFKKVLVAFKRLQSYVDAGSPNRNWNDATAMLISGKAGVQIMGDWAKGEFAAARQTAGKDYGCIAGLGPAVPYLIQGDAFVFPKTTNADAVKAQKLLATSMLAPAAQLEFSKLKGSLPVRSDIDVASMDACAQAGMAIMKDKSRQVGMIEVFLTPDQNGALQDVLTAFWNTKMPVEKAQKSIAAALRD